MSGVFLPTRDLLWEPPRRISDIVEVLNAVDDITLDTVRTMVLPLKEKKGDVVSDLVAGEGKKGAVA